MKPPLLLFATLAALAVLAAPYQASQTSQDKKKEPAPLFGGQIGTRSSKTTKESATLGFNGIDPSGKVDKKMLAASPTALDAAKVRNMDTSRPARTEVAAFLREGGLRTK